MANGNIRVGNDTPADASGWQVIEQLASRSGAQSQLGRQSALKGAGTEHCDAQGAMSEQNFDCAPGNQSFPQKLVQLVGYRDPRSYRESWHPPQLDARSGKAK